MVDDLDAYLKGLPDQLHNAIAPVIKGQAEQLSAAQRQALQTLERAPQETGDLEASCTTTPGRDDLEVIVQAGGELTTKEVREGSGFTYDYAEAFEFGTSRQPARPFFYSTYDARRDGIQAAINDAISEALK